MSKPKLIYIVIPTLLVVGLLPLILTGWFLSERSGTELRAVENRYQIQLVQEKARSLEMFLQRQLDLVGGLSSGFALAGTPEIYNQVRTDMQLEEKLRENPDVLALFVTPPTGETLALYRPGNIGKQQIDTIANTLIASSQGSSTMISRATVAEGSNESVVAIGSRIGGKDGAGSVIAIVSLTNIGKILVGKDAVSEEQMWAAGLPIILIVDGAGRAIFHPDPQVAQQQRPLTSLRIVSEWQQSSEQIQSGLVPFVGEFGGNEHSMIGAYSTVDFGQNAKFGVITMQDEAKALASVGEMRTQTWIISLAFGLFASLFGLFVARQLAQPILRLSEAAETVANGDLSTRVEVGGVKETATLGSAFNTMSDRLEEHIRRLAQAAQENRELFVGTVKALAAAIDGKDKYTRGHSERVARISVAIGKEMNLPEDELEALRISALLHDVGKIAIDDSILKKPAALTAEEFDIMKTHPVKGYKIMSQIPGMDAFLPGMYMHHEMVNGEGYPQGLKGDEIPLQGKIVSVADTFDAMTIDRPYSKGMVLSEALDRIRGLVGTRYDGAVVEALVRGCQKGLIGRGVVQQIATNVKEGERGVNVGIAQNLKLNSGHDSAELPQVGNNGVSGAQATRNVAG
ncbi:MAG: HD domain-containing protein [Acidobacteria bacterium]|nr:HD domain-containing protein [Acidobacteriota bacterium]